MDGWMGGDNGLGRSELLIGWILRFQPSCCF